MTTTATPSVRHAGRLRPYASVILAPRGDGGRRRSGSDAVRVLVAVLAVITLGLACGSIHTVISSVTTALHPPPYALSWLFTFLWQAGSIGVVILMGAVALLARRMEVVRDLGVAVGIALGTCYLIQIVFGADVGIPKNLTTEFVGINLGFPTPALVAASAASLVSLPYLSRTLQRTLEAVLLIGVVSGLVHGAGLPIALIASIIIGWGGSAAAHLIFGSPTGVPAASDVEALLAELPLDASQVHAAEHQPWGLARFLASGADGSSLRISLYGRDAQESQLFAKIYRTIFLRQDVGPFALTRAQQLEHEAYATLLAATASPGTTATMAASGLVGPSNDAIVVTSVPQGKSIGECLEAGDAVSSDVLSSLASSLLNLRSKKVAHGSVDLDHVIVVDDGAVLVDFDRSLTHADEAALNHDLASLMVIASLCLGTDGAVELMQQKLGTELMAASLPLIQDPALPPALSGAVRKGHDRAMLKELREKAAAAAKVDVPKLAELHRLSWVNLFLAVGTLIGGWALIGVFLHVAQSASTLAHANWFWVIITAVVSQLAYFGSALSSQASIVAPLPLAPMVVLELSNTFSGLALGTPAVMAARIRFFQKQGVDSTLAVSSGVLVSTASWIVKGGLFLISLPFALGTIDVKKLFHPGTGTSGGSASSSEIITYLLIGIVLIGVLAFVAFFVPKVRKLAKDRVLPHVHEVIDHFKVLAGRPGKVIQIFGGMAIAQMVVAIALSTSLAAFGHHLAIPVILVVLTIGSMLGGVSPVPGGMGVVEAGMILALKACGIPDDVAVAAVFVQRLFTAYLPPIAGWFALMGLRRREYL